MSLSIFSGNIFTTKCQTIVNTVNCVGVMGAGIALECRLRWPEMFGKYTELCSRHEIDIGKSWLYKTSDRWILNFPTKKHWKDPSREEFLHAGLKEFMRTYNENQIGSIAFPLLGAQHGGISPYRSQKIMESYLQKCEIPVEIYKYDPTAIDDLYGEFKKTLLNMSVEAIKFKTGLRIDYVQRVLDAIDDKSICQLNRLASIDGIGVKTLEKIFSFVIQETSKPNKPVQGSLFGEGNF